MSELMSGLSLVSTERQMFAAAVKVPDRLKLKNRGRFPPSSSTAAAAAYVFCFPLRKRKRESHEMHGYRNNTGESYLVCSVGLTGGTLARGNLNTLKKALEECTRP